MKRQEYIMMLKNLPEVTWISVVQYVLKAQHTTLRQRILRSRIHITILEMELRAMSQQMH